MGLSATAYVNPAAGPTTEKAPPIAGPFLIFTGVCLTQVAYDINHLATHFHILS